MSKTLLKIDKPMMGRKVGTVVSVDLESASIEAIHFRRRLKDAGIDNCVKVYKPEPKTVAKKKKVISDAE